MVDASLSISAPRPPAAALRAAPPASSFAASLPAATPPGAGPPSAPPSAAPFATTPSAAATTATVAASSPGPSSSAAPASRPGPASPPGAATTPKPAAAPPSAFHVLLSELNPLQYVPVVGTIYRAVTGDTVPETARFAGGLVVSGLTGGPVGIAMNLGATLIEHLVGIDPEKLGDRLLAELGIGHAAPAHAAPTALAAATPPATAAPAAVAPAPASPTLASSAPASSARAWSPAQLAAYGVTGGSDGTLRRGTVSGADVLNFLELARIAPAAAA